MVLFVFCLIFAVLAAIAFGVAPFVVEVTREGTKYEEHPRKYVRIGASALVVLSLVFLFFASFTTVSTKNVAVLTTFGKPTGYVNNGFHFKAPWEKPHEISDAVQTDTYASDPEDPSKPQGGASDTCIHVRIERQAIACVNSSIRWQIKPSGVDFLYRNYKSNDHITDNVVLRDLQQAENIAFANYDPLALDSQTGLSTNAPLTTYSNVITKRLRNEIGKWIDVQSVVIPLLSYDTATQQKVQQVLGQIAQTQVAKQAEQTALAQAKANKALAESVSNDPNVLVSKCLDILKEAVDKGQALPAGFSCFGTPNNISVAAK